MSLELEAAGGVGQRRVGGAIDLGLGLRRDGERRRVDRQRAGGAGGGEGPVAGIGVSDRVGRIGHGEAGGIEGGGEGAAGADGGRLLVAVKVTATVSPTGACEPSASVPEMVTLEVP